MLDRQKCSAVSQGLTFGHRAAEIAQDPMCMVLASWREFDRPRIKTAPSAWRADLSLRTVSGVGRIRTVSGEPVRGPTALLHRKGDRAEAEAMQERDEAVRSLELASCFVAVDSIFPPHGNERPLDCPFIVEGCDDPVAVPDRPTHVGLFPRDDFAGVALAQQNLEFAFSEDIRDVPGRIAAQARGLSARAHRCPCCPRSSCWETTMQLSWTG